MVVALYDCGMLLLWYWTCRVEAAPLLLAASAAACAVIVSIADRRAGNYRFSLDKAGGWGWNTAATVGVVAAAANWSAAWPAVTQPQIAREALASVKCLGGLGILSGIIGISVYVKAHFRAHEALTGNPDGHTLALEHAECAALFGPTVGATVTLFAVGVVALLVGYNSASLPITTQDVYFYAGLAAGMIVWLLRPLFERMKDIRIRLSEQIAPKTAGASASGPPSSAVTSALPSSTERQADSATQLAPQMVPESLGRDVLLAEYADTNEMLRKALDILFRCGATYITINGFGIAVMAGRVLVGSGRVGVLVFLIVVDLLSIAMTLVGYNICRNFLARLAGLAETLGTSHLTLRRNRAQLKWAVAIGITFVLTVLAATVALFVITALGGTAPSSQDPLQQFLPFYQGENPGNPGDATRI